MLASLLYATLILPGASAVSTPGWSTPLFLGVGAPCHYHAIADLNNDGRPDLIVPTRSNGVLHVFLNQGGQTFSADMPVPSVGDVISVAALDIDGDLDSDLLAVGRGTATLRIHINNGAGGFSDGPSIPLGGAGHGIDVGDLNADGRADAVVTSDGIAKALVFWNDGSGTLLPGPALSTGPVPYYVTVADVDADHYSDLVVSDWAAGTIAVFRNDGASGFIPQPPFGAQGAQPGKPELSDIDGDGAADLLVPHLAATSIARFESLGGGAFTHVGAIRGPLAGYSLGCSDLDFDGENDLVVGLAPAGGIAVVLQNSGSWDPPQMLSAGLNINAIRLVDLDGNGSPDITASAHDSNALVVVFNGIYVDCNSNGTPDPIDVSSGASADCDANGVPDECDLAVGPEADCDSDGHLDVCEIIANPNLDVDADGTLDLCEIPGTPFCFGDGSIPTLCPCVPPNIVPSPGSAPGHGCANSFNADGALLSSTGTTAPDSVRFTCTISSNYANFALMIKGNASSPNGVQLNDGIMCVSGAIVRFGSHYAATGGAPLGSWTFPNTIQTTPVSTATAQGPAQHAYYQLYYRNAMPNFCTAATANLSNAVDVFWR